MLICIVWELKLKELSALKSCMHCMRIEALKRAQCIVKLCVLYNTQYTSCKSTMKTSKRLREEFLTKLNVVRMVINGSKTTWNVIRGDAIV